MSYSPPNAFPTADLKAFDPDDRKRAAIYLAADRIADGRGRVDLLISTRHAEGANLRVVLISQEEVGAPVADVGRSRLRDLISRMADGEFETIVAVGEAGEPVTISSRGPDFYEVRT